MRISELGKRGAVTKRITLIVGTGTKEMGKVPYAKAVHSVKVAVVSSLRAQARRGAPTGCAAPRMTADGL